MEGVERDRSDHEVIREVLEGRVDAFEVLVERYQDHVCGIVARRVPRDEIEEVAHEAFVRAYRSLRTLRAGASFQPWLTRIAVRTCHDFWRDRYRSRETPVSALGNEDRQWIHAWLDGGGCASGRDEGQERRARRVLDWALDRLSPEDRAVLTLVHMEGYTTAEAADLLRWSVPKVKIRAYRARKRLRKALWDVLRGGPDGRRARQR